MAAYFARQANGTIDKLVLSKLLYLSERESMSARGRPMFYDEHYSLKDGPICSSALNGVNGRADKAVWAEYVVKQDNRTIKLAPRAATRELDELSKSDVTILDEVWKRFGWMSPHVIRRWTHEQCAEYRDVTAGRLPIPDRDIFAALGYENADEMAESVTEYRSMEAALAAE